MRRFSIAALAAAALVLGGAGASAMPLNLSSNPPDVFSSLLDVDFTSGVLTVSGTSFTFDDDGIGTAEAITSGTFDLTAVIDAAGNASSGSLDIGGTIPALGFNSGLLLTGTLTDFGFALVGNGEPLEFLFNVTGGDLAVFYPGIAGVILTGSGFPGSFAGDFSNDGFGLTNTAPEPALLGLLIGGAGLIVAGRRRSA